MTDDARAAEISKILATWGPVDQARAEAIGLSDYDVEAHDILWAMELHGYSVKRAVSAVLTEAFLIAMLAKLKLFFRKCSRCRLFDCPLS